MPDGHLSIGHYGNATKWFYYLNGKQIYLSKAKRKTAQKLALKKYLSIKLELLNAELKYLTKTNRYVTMPLSKMEKLLSDSAYLDLLSEYFVNSTLESHYWANTDYPKNNKHPENLTHPTVGGLLVRSKSESMIAIALSDNHIPFRYENLLRLDGKDYAPDFTILHPTTNRIYYWEHFGMMDNSVYCNDFSNKIKVYSKNGIILGDNLIASFESKTSPLNFQTINNLIKQNFL